MRVLHLFSNYKWTGPAEPALNLAAALRDQGLDVEFACCPIGSEHEEYMAGRLRARGFDPILDFRLPKSRNLNLNLPDILKLRGMLRERPFDLVHCHLHNDHSIAARGAGTVPIVRSTYEGDGIRRLRRRTAFCLKRTAHLIEPSRIALEHDCATYRFPTERASVVPGAIDTQRFDPQRVTHDMRDSLRIPRDAFVFGIVARMQRHRMFEVLLGAFRDVASADPDAHLLVVGRGTNQEEVAKAPVREMGLSDRVHFPGYVSGDDFVATLNSFDAKVFMVPGTDGTCRAVREAMAMGVPAIVNRVGMLPELVEHERTGLVFDGSQESLAAAMTRLIEDRAATRTMGESAGTVAHEEFAIEHQAGRVVAIYEDVLNRVTAD